MGKPKINTYCGLDCDSCEYKDKNNCKGCIASNGEPFHGECAVVKCSKEKNYDGCWECDELLSCGKGFYKSDNDGARACKAQAMFIKNHGKEEFLKVRDKLRQINPDMKKFKKLWMAA